MSPYLIYAAVAAGLLFVFLNRFQNKVSSAVHVVNARAAEFSNAIRHLWPFALIAAGYVVADKFLDKFYH